MTDSLSAGGELGALPVCGEFQLHACHKVSMISWAVCDVFSEAWLPSHDFPKVGMKIVFYMSQLFWLRTF